MKRAVKIFFFGLLAALVLVASAIIWIVNDEDLIRRELERYVSGWSGRALTVGALELDLGRLTKVRLGNIHFANADWATDQDFISIQSLESVIDLGGVLKGEVMVESLRLDGVSVNLEETVGDEVNWRFLPQQDENEATGPVKIPLRQLRVSKFQLTHQSPKREVPLQFAVDTLSAGNTAEGALSFAAKGVVGGYPLDLEGRVDPLQSLFSGGALRQELDLQLGEVRLHSQASVEDTKTGAGAQVNLRFSGPEIGWVLDQAALPAVSSGPFDILLELDRAEGRTLLLNIEGDLGSVQTTVNGVLDKLVNPSRMDLRFDLSGPDLRALGETLGVADLPQAGYEFSGEIEYDQHILQVHQFAAGIGQDHLSASGIVGPWPTLTGTELDFTASGLDISAWGPTMGVEALHPSPFTMEGHFFEQDGTVAFSGSKFVLGESSLELDGTLGELPDFIGAELKFGLVVPDISTIARRRGVADFPPYSASLTGSALRNAQGVKLDGISLALASNKLSLEGFVMWKAGDNDAKSASLRDRLSGSYLTAQVEMPNAREIADLIGIGNAPPWPLVLDFQAQLEPGALTFSVNDARLGMVNLGIKGNLPEVPGLEGAVFDFRADSPNLQSIGAHLEIDGFPALPAQLEGSIRRIADGLVLENAHGTVGKSRLQLSGELALEQTPLLSNARFSASGPDFRNLFDHASLAGLPANFSISGSLVQGDAAQRIESLTVGLGRAELTVQGEVDNVFAPEVSDLQVHVTVPDPAEFRVFLARWGDIPTPPEPLSLGFSVRSAPGSLNFTRIQAAMGKGDLAGELAISLGERPEYRGAFESDYLDLSWWSTGDGQPDVDVAATTAGGASGRRVFSSEPLPFLSIDPMLLDARLRAAAIALPNLSVSDVDVGMWLTENELKLDPLVVAGAGGGRLTGSVSVDQVEGEIDASIDVIAVGFRPGLSTGKGQDASNYPSWDVAVDIKALGSSMHQLANSAQGEMEVIVNEGLIRKTELDLMFSDLLSELFSTLNPFARESEFTRIDCGVAKVKFTGGLAHIEPLLLQTDKILVSSKGIVRLDSETIDLLFNTRPRKGIGISPGMAINPFIKLAGTLANPSISLDAEGAAVEGGVAVATAGLSILGRSLYDRYLGERDACGKVVAELRSAHKREVEK